jgi:ribosomal protein L23
LSFVDAEKLSGAHDYSYVRKDSHRAALEKAVKEIFGVTIAIIIE